MHGGDAMVTLTMPLTAEERERATTKKASIMQKPFVSLQVFANTLGCRCISPITRFEEKMLENKWFLNSNYIDFKAMSRRH